jgi:glutamate formiminotransferase/glutamate formiminotransferase/formiminotetrahydrofolate cyclodeaminase
MTPPLLAVPNISEGRDPRALAAVEAAFTATPGTTLLDGHADPDHHRAVLTLAGAPGSLSRALLAGAAAATEQIDVMSGPHPRGEHPHVGAVDVIPLVYLSPETRGAACAEALLVADRIGQELRVPVFLYGDLAGGRTRAELRRGGPLALRERMRAGELSPDFGPPQMHPTAGATLVAAREPLVAFNLELAPPATVEDARRIAALIREGGAEGRPGLRAIGVALTRPQGSVAQVSMNVERPLELPLREVVQAVRRHADVTAAELVGLAPRAALRGFPAEVALGAFDPARQVIEKALGL